MTRRLSAPLISNRRLLRVLSAAAPVIIAGVGAVTIGFPPPPEPSPVTHAPTLAPIGLPEPPQHWPRHEGRGFALGLPPAWLVAEPSQLPSQAVIDSALEPLKANLLLMRQHVATGTYDVVGLDPKTIDARIPVASGVAVVSFQRWAVGKSFDDLVAEQAGRLQAQYALADRPTAQLVEIPGFDATEFRFAARGAWVSGPTVEVARLSYVLRRADDVYLLTFMSMPDVAEDSLVTFRQVVASMEVSAAPEPS